MKRIKCEECGAKIIKDKVEFSMYGVVLGKFPAEVCSKCGEKVFDEATSQKIDKAAKSRGLWGLDMKIKVVKIGNSLAIRIPKKISTLLGLKEGSGAVLHPDKDKLIIESC